MKNKYKFYYIVLLIVLPIMSILTLSFVEFMQINTIVIDQLNNMDPELSLNNLSPELSLNNLSTETIRNEHNTEIMSNDIPTTQGPEAEGKPKEEVGINYHLVIGIIISTIIVVGGIYLLFKYGYLDFVIDLMTPREVIIKRIAQLTREFQPVIGFDIMSKMPLTLEMSDAEFKAMYGKLVNLMQIIKSFYLENVDLARDSKTIVVIIESIIAGTNEFKIPDTFSWNLFGQMVIKRQQLHLNGLLTVEALKASNDWFMSYLNLKFAD